MKSRILWAAIATTTLAATGCAVVPYPPGQPYYEGAVVVPPPPHVEYVGRPPVVGQIWIDGMWNWTGRRHEWVDGRWETPRRGAHWVPRRWERDGDRWRQNGGYRDEGRGRR